MGIKRMESEFGLAGRGNIPPSRPYQGREESRKGRGRSVTATSPDRQPGESSAPGLVFLGPGCPHPDRVETERDAISHANGAGRSATKGSDAVVRLFYRETARRPQRVRPDLRANVTAHITSLPGECEPALDLKSVGGARYAI